MDWAAQGGMKNYLGEQEMVSAPKHWQSRPDKPPTELAYITEPEKDLIMQADIHGSLSPNVKGNYAPNEGPSGLMSLDYQGDKGTYGQTGQSYGDRERPGQSSTPSGQGSHHPGVGPTKKTTKTASPKDHFEQSWTGQPGFLGFGGGYRNLKTPGSTAGGHKSRFNPLSMLLGLINPALGMAVRGFQGLKNFGKHETLADWWGSRKKGKEEEEFEGTMPRGYYYDDEGKLRYNAPRGDFMGEFGFKDDLQKAPPYDDSNFPGIGNVDMQNYLEDQSNFMPGNFNYQSVDPSSPEFRGIMGVDEVETGSNDILNDALMASTQGIIPGLEPINTMNNPTWNNETQRI